ncbi:MAG TPA: hypothetical protein VK593_02050, partial [Edaphobacter sp.]|nr:hypothetical protein [Edaphobacter sp.]
MANTWLNSTDEETRDAGPTLRPAVEAPKLNEETEGSMWASLIGNLRDLFNPVKQAPLNLESKPIESDLVIEDEGVFTSLKNSIVDVFFPKKLPPLVLESTPIAVPDLLRAKQDPKATGSAIAIYVLLFLLVAWLLHKKVPFAAPVKQPELTNVTIPPMAPMKAQAMGGGGGQRGPTPVTKGTPPKFADTQIVPPKAPP